MIDQRINDSLKELEQSLKKNRFSSKASRKDNRIV